MGNKKDELLDLAQRQINAAQDADMAAQDAANERELADQMETEALAASHKAEAEGLANYNKAQYANMGQILSDVQGKIDEAKQKDETARRRENAFRYISGLGDTLSGVANLIGTAHGAANQKQTYNSHAVVQKAEEARKARKLEMDELSKRLDEMTARQREMQAAGSLKEVELKARHDKEKAALAATQRKAAEEAKKYADTQNYRAMRDATEDWQRERTFNAQQNQWQKNYDLQLRKFNEEQKGNKYNFTFSDGSVDIPKEKINDANIERIFQMIPEDIRANIKGEQTTVYETDELGNSVRKTGNKAPSLSQKLAAIAAYAESDENMKNELRRLAGESPKAEGSDGSPTATTDWSAFKVGGSTSAATPAATPVTTPTVTPSAMGYMVAESIANRPARVAARAERYAAGKEQGKAYMPYALMSSK